MAGVDVPAVALTLVLGALGGLAGFAAHLPLGFLLGSLLVVGGTAAFGLRPFGMGMALPFRLRMSFVPVIGVAIGGAFTPAALGQAAGWVPSLLALCLYVPLAHAIGYGLYRRGGLPKAEAYFGAVPGGLIESLEMGEEAGADVRVLTALHFLRLILTIVTVPLLFWALTGQVVGSASGAKMAGAGAVLAAKDWGLLALAGAAGAVGARALRLPGWIVTGPILLSAGFHATGLVHGGPPGWLVAVTQVVLGTGLGARFAGIERAMLLRAGGLAVINGAASLSLALVFAVVLRALVGEPVTAVFLAFAPGGLAEMSLIALSLHMSVVFVTVHHVARIALAVGFAQLGVRRLTPANPDRKGSHEIHDPRNPPRDTGH